MGKKRQWPSGLINCAKRFFIPHSISLTSPFQIRISEYSLEFWVLHSAIRTPHSALPLCSRNISYNEIPHFRGAISHLTGAQAFHILFHHFHDRLLDVLSRFRFSKILQHHLACGDGRQWPHHPFPCVLWSRPSHGLKHGDSLWSDISSCSDPKPSLDHRA